MLKLLKIEWMKVKGYTGFQAFTILYLFAMIGMNFIGFYINEQLLDLASAVPMGEALVGSPYSFPKVWQTTAWMNSWLLYFPGILFIILLSNEFSFRTHRQNIIDGMSRRGFIHVKFLMAVIFAIGGTLMNFLVAFLFGSFSKRGHFSFEGIEFIGYGFVQLLVYTCFAMVLAILFRRSGIAIVVFLLFGLIFENIASNLVNNKLQLSPVGYFFPLQVSDSLIDMPFGDIKKNLLYAKAPAIWIMVLVSFAYSALYFFLTRRKFLRDDL